MSKYTHDRLITMIKQDAKNIKKAQESLKNSDILNTLSQFFGWRHFNELSKHIENNHEAYISLSTLSFDELNVFKTEYFDFVYKQFPIDKHTIFDPYQLLDGALYNLVNHKRFAINFGKGNNLDVDLRRNNIFLSLTDKEMRHFVIAITEHHSNDSQGDGMWKGRAQVLIHAMLTAFENDPDQTPTQDLVYKSSSLAFLVDYQKNYLRRGGEAKHIDGVKMVIFNLPSMEQDSTYSEVAEEQYGYLWMQFGAFHKRFLKHSEEHTTNINMTDLKNHNGQVTFIYPDHRDYLMDIEILCTLFDTERVAQYDRT
jgi:hypothetical protein